MKNYIIQGKGYWNVQLNDPFISGVQTTDIESSYNHIKFKGTEKQLESFIDLLLEDETYFKFRDVFTKEEYDEKSVLLTDLDVSKIVEIEDNTDLKGELACAGGSCEII